MWTWNLAKWFVFIGINTLQKYPLSGFRLPMALSMAYEFEIASCIIEIMN